jgi:hypothetical protein
MNLKFISSYLELFETSVMKQAFSGALYKVSHCGGEHDRWGRCSGLCYLGRRGLRQPLWRRARQVRALLSHVFARSARAQPATVVADTKLEGTALASVRLVVEGSARHCGGGHESWERSPGFCSLGRRGLSQPLWWRARQVRALLWPLFAWSAWAQPGTVVASTTGESARLSSNVWEDKQNISINKRGTKKRNVPIPVAVWSKAWVYGLSLTGIVGSNPA